MTAREKLFAPNPNEEEEMKIFDETFEVSMKNHEPVAEAQAVAAVLKARYPAGEVRVGEIVVPVERAKEAMDPKDPFDVEEARKRITKGEAK